MLPGQTLKFLLPVRIGDVLTATLTVKEKLDEKKYIILDCQVKNQNGEVVVEGDAKVRPPREAGELTAPDLPRVTVAGLDD